MTQSETAAPLPWGESPYDSKTPAEVVHDYVVVRGDLTEPYAREQLARWIERYAAAKVDVSIAALREYADERDQRHEADPNDYNAGASDAATHAISRALRASLGDHH